MDPATSDDRRRRRLLIAATAGGLALLLLVGVGIYGLVRGPAAPSASTPNERPSTAAPVTPAPTSVAELEPLDQHLGPEAFAQAVAEALFTWDTTTGHMPSDYAQVLADAAHGSEADAFVAASLSSLPLVPRLVFLVVGPAVDLKLMAMQTGSFGRRFVARFAPLCLVVAVGCGTAAGALLVGWR